MERGWGVKILEDARHSYVLYICKYFVVESYGVAAANSSRGPDHLLKKECASVYRKEGTAAESRL